MGQTVTQNSVGGMEDKEPDDPGDGRGNPKGPENGGPIKSQAPNFLVDQNSKKEGDGRQEKVTPREKIKEWYTLR